MLPAEISIDDLIPHRDGMQLIGSVLDISEAQAVTLSVVAADWPLVENQHVDAIILIELVAQTAGVNNGWTRIKERGLQSDKKGWLVGIKRADFFVDRIPVGTPIEVRVENRFAYDNFREVQGAARIGADVAAEVILQVFQSD